MTAASVLDLLDLLRGAGAAPWVDGGWGVDALLGHPSRPHADLDVVIAEDAVPAAREALSAAGFTVLRDWLPTALAMRHPDGREVDLHPVTPTDDGGGDQQLFPPDPPFHYAPPTTGVIAGTGVTCVDAVTQLRAHVGYEPQPEDRADVEALAARFGLPLPPGYWPRTGVQRLSGRRNRARWAAVAVAAALVAAVTVMASWGGQCTSTAEGVASGGCSSGPQLGVISVFALLVDVVVLLHAVRRVRQAGQRDAVDPGPVR